MLNRPNPVASIVREDTWTVFGLTPGCMQPPSTKSVEVAASGFVDMHSPCLGPCKMKEAWLQLPSAFYHGTCSTTLLTILLEGRFASAGNLGITAHSPDGVYAYSNQEVSSQSMYAQAGCQITFAATCFALSWNDSKLVKVVPEGVACRVKRSAWTICHAAGTEWIFHPWSCEIKECRVLTASMPAFMQAVTAALSDLSGPLSNASFSAATCTPRPRPPRNKARNIIINHRSKVVVH